MTTEPAKDFDLNPERRLLVERTEKLLKGVNIPPRPVVLVELLNEQAKSETDIQRVADIISGDVALAASTLKIVNSPFFGLRRKIGSVSHAVRLIGVNNVVNLVTGLMLHSAFKGERSQFMNHFWASSRELAMIAATVARLRSEIAPDEAYTLGLFCDCGVPLLLRRYEGYPDIYAAALDADDVTVTEYEDRELGTDHTAVGFLVARSWKLPPVFCQGILRHHDLIDYYGDDDVHQEDRLTAFLAITKLSRELQRLLHGKPVSYEWAQIGGAVMGFLRIREEELTDLTNEIREMLEEHP